MEYIEPYKGEDGGGEWLPTFRSTGIEWRQDGSTWFFQPNGNIAVIVFWPYDD